MSGSERDAAPAAPPLPVMSIDVEDWFQVENLKPVVPRESWDEREYRVEASTERVLQVFADTDTRATFFCLAWVAERSPALVRRIADAGHEVASHGYGHELVYNQSDTVFREDVRRARAILQDLSGQAVIGYRAPSFSITPRAADILAEEGYRYDSSVFPVGGHDRYSRIAADELEPAAAVRAPQPPGQSDPSRAVGPPHPAGPRPLPVQRWRNCGLIELPITTHRIAGRTLPWGGGGWFRLIPAGAFRRGFARAVAAAGGGVFYLHPWELDPGQPRLSGLRASHRFRHYVHLHRTEDRLRALCRAIRFGRADALLPPGNRMPPDTAPPDGETGPAALS